MKTPILRSLAIPAIILIVAGNLFAAARFLNPLQLTSGGGCAAGNIDPTRFTAKIDAVRRERLCVAVDAVVERLNNGKWTPQFAEELDEVWRIFHDRKVVFDSMPAATSRQILALTESFPDDVDGDSFVASVHLKTGVEQKDSFYHVLLHELRHVYDFHEIWLSGRNLPQYEIERRAFHMMSVFDQQTPAGRRFSKVPQLWNDEWSKLPAGELEYEREEAIARFLKKSRFYGDLPAESTLPGNATQAVGPMPDDSEYVRPRLIRKKN